jgi:outer membrane protein W
MTKFCRQIAFAVNLKQYLWQRFDVWQMWLTTIKSKEGKKGNHKNRHLDPATAVATFSGQKQGWR